jgi:AcrR family transcriptional regulator
VKYAIPEIAVQDITEAATVNRATFYDHYTDKYALLDAMVAGGFHMLLHERNVQYDGSCPSAASAIILATCDYLTQAHGSGTRCQSQSAFEPLVEGAIVTAIRRVLMGGVAKAGSNGRVPGEMIATAASWAIFGAVKEWFKTPDRAPADEIVPIILELILPILRTAGEAAGPVGSPHLTHTAHR